MSVTDDLRDRIENVSNADASGPHLVTLAVPPETRIDAALERVEEEHARTEYIDSDETTERVTEALERTRRALNEYDETPENGLVVYAGVLDAETVEYTFDDLPSPVSEMRYERANEFDTEPLDVSADESTYGLVVVEHGKAALGRFVDGDVEPVGVLESDTAEDNPTSGELGDREQVDREFFERVAERAGVEFLDENPDEERREQATPDESDIDPVEGVFVGGSSVTASEFLDGEYLDHRLRERVVGDALGVGDASEAGLEQLAEKADERVERIEHERVRDLLDEFRSGLDDGEGEEAVVGREATEEALDYEGVETTLASEDLPAEDLRSLEGRTVAQGGEFVLVPTDLDGADRLREEGKVGALVRFPIEE